MVLSVTASTLAHAMPSLTSFAPQSQAAAYGCHGENTSPAAPQPTTDHARLPLGVLAPSPCCAGASSVEVLLLPPLLRDAMLPPSFDTAPVMLQGRSVAPGERPPRLSALS